MYIFKKLEEVEKSKLGDLKPLLHLSDAFDTKEWSYNHAKEKDLVILHSESESTAYIFSPNFLLKLNDLHKMNKSFDSDSYREDDATALKKSEIAKVFRGTARGHYLDGTFLGYDYDFYYFINKEHWVSKIPFYVLEHLVVTLQATGLFDRELPLLMFKCKYPSYPYSQQERHLQLVSVGEIFIVASDYTFFSVLKEVVKGYKDLPYMLDSSLTRKSFMKKAKNIYSDLCFGGVDGNRIYIDTLLNDENYSNMIPYKVENNPMFKTVQVFHNGELVEGYKSLELNELPIVEKRLNEKNILGVTFINEEQNTNITTNPLG